MLASSTRSMRFGTESKGKSNEVEAARRILKFVPMMATRAAH